MFTHRTQVCPLTLQSLLGLAIKICSYLNKQAKRYKISEGESTYCNQTRSKDMADTSHAFLCYFKPACDCLHSQTFQDPATTTTKVAKGKGCGLVAFTHFQSEVKYPVVFLVPWSWQLLETSSTAIVTFFLGPDALTHHVWISSRAYHTHVLPASKLPISKLCSLVPLPKDSP